MPYFFLLFFSILLISFLTGSLVKKYFHLKSETFSFSAPIGFLVFLGILQFGYFFISYLQLSPRLFLWYTSAICLVLVLLSMFEIRWIVKSIKSIRFTKLICVLVLFTIIFYIFANSPINYRLDDINFYAEFIPNRIVEKGISQIQYSLQAFFTLLSILIKYGPHLSILNVYTDFYPVALVIWIPALLSAWMISCMLVDMTSYLKNRIQSKKWSWFIIVSVTIIFLLDYWYFSTVYAPGTLRRLAIPYLLILLNDTEFVGFEPKRFVLVSFVVGGFIALSSSAFPLSVIILFIYLIYNMMTKKSYYLRKLLIIILFPLLYGAAYIESLYAIPYFFIAVMLIYLGLIGLALVKVDLKIESFLNRYSKGIIIGFIIVFYGAAILLPNQIGLMVGNRTFYTPINKFDMVPNLIHGQTVLEIMFNTLFWCLNAVAIVLMIKTKKMNGYLFLVLFTLLIFFNPITYSLIVRYLMASAYFRITDILFNVIILYELSIVIYECKVCRPFLILCLSVMLVCRVASFRVNLAEDKATYNYIYHTTNQDIEVMEKLNNDYLQFEDKDHFNIASQIYGGQFFTKSNVTNLLEDRFSYFVLDVSEFERVFYRRTPGYEDIPVDYKHACTLAFEKETDYVILEAQYNWQLQEGLWPCSELLFEEGTFRILKMNYEYWEYNIQQGFTEKFDLK